MSEYILKKTNIGSTPGPVFGRRGKRHIRFAFSTNTDDVKEAAEIIREKL